MEKQKIGVLEVVAFLCEGQGEVAKAIQKGVQAYWDPKYPSAGFLAFTVQLGLNKEAINWELMLKNIEITLTDPSYAEHADTICTHVLEGLSNKVSNGSLGAKILIDYAGPLSRAHMKSWELAMTGKTNF